MENTVWIFANDSDFVTSVNGMSLRIHQYEDCKWGWWCNYSGLLNQGGIVNTRPQAEAAAIEMAEKGRDAVFELCLVELEEDVKKALRRLHEAAPERTLKLRTEFLEGVKAGLIYASNGLRSMAQNPDDIAEVVASGRYGVYFRSAA